MWPPSSAGVPLPLGARCHSTSLSAGLYLLLFFSAQTSPPSSSSLILFMKGAHSIILSPYISVCPSFSPHLSAPRREGGREKETGQREREREMDRLGGGDKRSISRPNSRRRASFPPALPPLSTPLGPSSLCCASNLCSLQTDKGSLRNHFVCASAHKCVRMCTYTFACLPC